MADAATVPYTAADGAGLNQAFKRYENGVFVTNARRTALLSALFMVAGSTLDWMVFPHKAWQFLLIRIVVALLLCVVFWLLGRFSSERSHRQIAHVLFMLPTVSICWMIAVTGGGNSPYYAGLNLVLLGLSLLLRSSFKDSVVMILLNLACYFCSVWFSSEESITSLLFNNSYFLVVTAVFVSAGSYFYERLRFREFALRKEVEDARGQLEATNKQLSELDEAKTRFFANISHELRTPLTVMIGLTERLSERFKPTSEKEVKDMLAMTEHNGLRLLKLIDDLLDLVRFDTGHADLKNQSTDVGGMLDGLMQSMRHLADQNGVALEWRSMGSQGHVMLDRDKIEKVLLNLTVNAIKFTPAGGRIDVDAVREGDRLKISVADTGVGISTEVLPRIFERFWQVDSSSTRKFQGAGIGLALVRSLVETMGGTIDAKSTVGVGTRFEVELPVENAEGSASEAVAVDVESGKHIEELHRRAALSAARPADAGDVSTGARAIGRSTATTRPLVLVADDEPDMRRFLVMQLENVDVIEARDGAEALALAKQHMPVLALVDHMMPEMDGEEVCRALRANHATREMPIIMLTARADEKTKLQALDAGASDFLTKPFSSSELVLRLRNQLAMAAIRRELADLNRDLAAAMEQLKENEVLLVRNEKLSGLGQMSAGIIHEINNPLNYARAGLHALNSFKRSLPADDHEDYAEIVGDISEGVERVAQIVADLRQFTRDDDRIGGDADLANVIERSRRLVSHQLGEKVAFNYKGPEKAPGTGNPNQLVQVFVNLFQNAVDAIQQRVDEKGGDPGRIDVTLRAAAGGWEVTVWDNGAGIPREIVHKIYDPFFTSKDVGKGMGLGLSITHQILGRHGAHIEVDTRPGEFTCFTIFFSPPDPDADDGDADPETSRDSEP
ncbi:ATP-binding protein [Luteolibacter flavescens]|uniref:histidine kinase n=1 Tax=Luteolibacter flavescens TaxID=1859460 RepID=A0ABT3FME0_9BACT|nr:ATP-binding protein [Luteolibacter flavescens]MCW1884739.1 ATP-binding protein [Luteolibacter flavescens]